MSTMNNAGLVAAKGLSEEWLQQIIDLAEVCEAHDGFDLSINLNLSMLQNRSPEQTNDFLYFQDGKLVGFLGMYAIVSPKEVEISGMVHPDYRGNELALVVDHFQKALVNARFRSVNILARL